VPNPRLKATFFANLVLQILDELRHIWIRPRQDFASKRAARQASIVQLRNRYHRAANSIESNHDAHSPNSNDKTFDKAVRVPIPHRVLASGRGRLRGEP
jgi:predicted aminopeptidase